MPETALPASPDYEDKLERLLDVAAEIFAEKGYHNTSIRDIAGRAGVSLSGLYYYFSSKEELLFKVQDRCFRTILQGLEARLRSVAEPEERLRALVHNHMEFFVRRMPAMKVLSHEYDSLTGEYQEPIRALRRQYVEICTEILRELRRSTGTSDAVVLRVATFALFGMMNWTHTWYRSGRDIPVDRLAEQVYRLFMGGFVAPAERRSTNGVLAAGAARPGGP